MQSGPEGNPAQMAAITNSSAHVMCLAGPGAGKTFVLTRRIRYLIREKQVEPSHILVITFSKASAIEMQKRFFSQRTVKYNTFCAQKERSANKVC